MEKKKKRRTYTSPAVKRRYAAKVYTQITFSAPKELVARFREACTVNGDSQASVFKQAMADNLIVSEKADALDQRNHSLSESGHF